MSEKYCRLCAADRKVIRNMKQGGSSQDQIGRAVGCSQSTISKELSRNRGSKGYREVQAERTARERQRAKRPRAKVVTGVCDDD